MIDRPDKKEYSGHLSYTWQPYRHRPLAVWAMRMNTDFEVKTLEGKLEGHAGDWLVRADDGQQFPVSDTVFTRFYSPREWKGENNAVKKDSTQDDSQKHDSDVSQTVDRQESGAGVGDGRR